MCSLKICKMIDLMTPGGQMSKKSIEIDMTSGPILPKLLMFSIPLILSSILQLLFNAADVIVVGQFAGKEALAAVGSTGSLVNLLVNLFVGLSVGSNVAAATYYGAGKKDLIHKTVHTSVLLSFISGIILTVVGVCFTKYFLRWMKSPENVIGLSTLYLRIYFAGITATMVYNFGSALLRAKGDTLRPLFILLIAGVINFLLNLLFVIVFSMSVAGVALATVISQCLAAGAVIFFLVKEKGDFNLDLRKLGIDKTVLLKILNVGVPAGVQGILFSFSNVIIQSAINGFGDIEVAGSSASASVEGFVWTTMNGFAQGALTFVSQNYGAGKIERIKKSVITAELTAATAGLILGNLVVLFGKQILSFYTKDTTVIDAAYVRLQFICCPYLLCGIMDTMASSIRGIGHSLVPTLDTLVGACLSRILWIMTVFTIPRFHTPQMIFITYPLSWILTFTVLLGCFIFFYSRLKKSYSSQKENESL